MVTEDISLRDFGALEAQVESLDKRVEKLEAKIEALSGKLDELIGLANKGKGAWWAGMTAASILSGLAAYFTTHFFSR